MLYTGWIYLPEEKRDPSRKNCWRASVVPSNDVETILDPHGLITTDRFEFWWPELAPQRELIKAFRDRREDLTKHLNVLKEAYDRKLIGPEEYAMNLNEIRQQRLLARVQYKNAFIEYLTSKAMERKIDMVIAHALKYDVELLCIEEFPNLCTRGVTAQVCKERNPRLEILIR